MEVADILNSKNISAQVINLKFLKPLDEKLLEKSIRQTKKVITMEDASIKGGVYTSIVELIAKNNINDAKIRGFAYGDKFVQHGSVEELEKLNNLDINSIVEGVLEII